MGPKHAGVSTIASLLFALAGSTTARAVGDEAAAARAVIEASGIQAGLCLHLGCGRADSAGLTAALAECSGMPVHGFALDDASVARARVAIEERGVPGRAMVEKLVERSLPYLPDLARLAVVEDLAVLSAAGIGKDEIFRVLAPGGSLCVKEGGKWTATTKPRPREMDEWTHPHHGPDGSLVSADRTLILPIGFRWIDGVPVNMGGWASCRAVVLAGGRCFTISVNELENLKTPKRTAWLAARDAYSGLPLWKVNCETNYGGAELDWRNVWPLVATDRRVYTVRKDELIVVDAASGNVETICPTKYRPKRLLLLDGVLVATCWEKAESKGKYEGDDLRAVWWPAGEGSVEALDAETSKPKWTLPLSVLTMAASDGMVYLLTHKGNPPTERNIVAVELATGKEKWRVPHTAVGEDADIYLSLAGPGCAVVSRIRGKPEVSVLSAKDGTVLFKVPNSSARSIVNGELWCSDGRYELPTGKKLAGGGVPGAHVGGLLGGCVPAIVVGGRYITGSRGGQFSQLAESPEKPPTKLSYGGARGACIQGMVPANGMFYTAQNNCACNMAQVGGFLAVGPCGDVPKAEEFGKPRPVEKGPAFGAVQAAASTDDWPTYRANAERSAGTSNDLPAELKMLWKMPCAKAGEGSLGESWRARMGFPQPLTAPVVAGGMVFVAGLDSGQLMALNPDTGATIWKASLGSRVDSPPTIHQGLCLLGCHDGWVYALRATDGAVAYRLRAAPRERRMVAHAMVESVWPATGSVLVHDGIAYVTAGRSTESDGGIALVAFKPETGETAWARRLGEKMILLQDVLSVQNGELAWHERRFDLKTGNDLPPVQRIQYHGGMLDGSWSAGYGIRSGRGFMLGKAVHSIMAWNDQMVVSPSFAVKRSVVDVPKPVAIGGVKNPEAFKKDEVLWGPDLEPASPWARVQAMALTGNTALFAGPVYVGCDPNRHSGNSLWLNSTATGKKLQPTIKLDVPPVFDGMAVAGGRVYLALQNGELLCWGKAE